MDTSLIQWGLDAFACEVVTDPETHLVEPYSWGWCAICRQTATVEGLRDIIEGSAWCAGHCPRTSERACWEPATVEMVAEWRAWAIEHVAQAVEARDWRKAKKTMPEVYMGRPAEVLAARGQLKARVVG